jgi:hypothetical protein
MNFAVSNPVGRFTGEGKGTGWLLTGKERAPIVNKPEYGRRPGRMSAYSIQQNDYDRADSSFK